VKVALHGATGRMGRTIARLVHECGDSIVGACAHAGDPNQGTDIGILAGIGEIGPVVGEDFAASLLGA
jgi:4-hydroxy-tetrahydrodipicolinate reductase